ncbi:DNA polymerase I [Crateriforma conspicua]|uniref:DNA polymerase I n=2 Tax=Crateriforma conspicua TaxID=2527996 RepID=A0A5C5Y6C0_9PLAN|nr:DNA polymerase I [Crateriforma conspicua]
MPPAAESLPRRPEILMPRKSSRRSADSAPSPAPTTKQIDRAAQQMTFDGFQDDGGSRSDPVIGNQGTEADVGPAGEGASLPPSGGDGESGVVRKAEPATAQTKPDAAKSTDARSRRRAAAGIATDHLPDLLQRPLPEPQPEPVPDLTDKLVIIVDAHSLIYQVFHALPPMTSTSGLPVSAVYGFVGDMLELISRKHPDYLIAAFDKSEVTFRNQLFDQYKAHRESMPDELRQQIPLLRQAIDAMGIGIMEQSGFEADDLLATVAETVQNAGGRCLVVTSDKDCRQLISDTVSVYNIRKDKEIDAAELWDLWGVRPDQVVDFQSLVGDPVDNVPGVPLIGPKLAQQLLEQFGTLDAVLDNADSVSGKKRKENLKNGREQALLSRELVRLRRDVDSPIPWSYSVRQAADLPRAQALFKEFGFRRLTDRVAEVLGDGESTMTPDAVWETDYATIDTVAGLKKLAKQLAKCEQIAIDTETTGTNPRASDLVGISIAWRPGQAAYIPVLAPEGQQVLDPGVVAEHLKPVVESESIRKIGQNLKYDVVVLRGIGLNVRGIAVDTMVADYLLNPGGRNHTLDDLARRYLNHQTTSIKELIGTGKKQIRMDQVDVTRVSDYACEDVDVPIRIADTISDQLKQADLNDLFADVEIPLIDVLAEMEFNGITVDAEYLRRMSEQFASQIEQLHQQIMDMSPRAFNVDSPKQLSEILFVEMKLPVIKKTKTGFSTDASVLEELAVNHELPAKVLEYRQLTKLKNTYIDALPNLICEKTGRIHTSFRQDVAATGRLSSSEPNLQNIPIRTAQGRAIRGAFTAGDEGWLLLGADYSQIELRVLAHYSGDPALIAAYHDGADIHTRVAAEVNEIAESDVTSDLRRIAKTINFGIVYGQSPFGLAKTLGISKDEARDYIELYFQRYQGVERFMTQTLIDCRNNGYVTTMLGRRRDVQGVRDIAKLDPVKRRSLTEPERIAVNTPIQGSAADLIKLAMLKVHSRLSSSALRARMLLQIHDELLFEVHQDDRQELQELVEQSMTGVVQLDVPLQVDVAFGKTWADT